MKASKQEELVKEIKNTMSLEKRALLDEQRESLEDKFSVLDLEDPVAADRLAILDAEKEE